MKFFWVLSFDFWNECPLFLKCPRGIFNSVFKGRPTFSSFFLVLESVKKEMVYRQYTIGIDIGIVSPLCIGKNQAWEMLSGLSLISGWFFWNSKILILQPWWNVDSFSHSRDWLEYVFSHHLVTPKLNQIWIFQAVVGY